MGAVNNPVPIVISLTSSGPSLEDPEILKRTTRKGLTWTGEEGL